MDAWPRGGERTTGEVMRPLLRFLSKEARETDDVSVLVQEGSERVSQRSGQSNMTVLPKRKKG